MLAKLEKIGLHLSKSDNQETMGQKMIIEEKVSQAGEPKLEQWFGSYGWVKDLGRKIFSEKSTRLRNKKLLQFIN